MSRKTIISPGEYYHIYNRGVEKRNIFISKRDYERFLVLLYLCNSKNPVHLQLQGLTLKKVMGINRGRELVDICAFTLMPNHFHLIVRELDERGVAKFMQKLTTGYTMYFNKVNERSGALFQGTYKTTHIDTDPYLISLISYVHLNPIKIIDPKWKENGIKDRRQAEEYLKIYPYSSYPDYLQIDRIHKIIINPNAFPKYFRTAKEFNKIVTEWLNFKVKP